MAKKNINKTISPAVAENFQNMLNSSVPTKEESSVETALDSLDETPKAVSEKLTKEEKEEKISSEVLQRQLDEATEKFLSVTEKLHKLEAENSRLVTENNLLKSKCAELESRSTSLENDLFNSNIEISEKLSKITDLESMVETLKRNVPNGYNIQGVLAGKTTKIGLNGYESWN